MESSKVYVNVMAEFTNDGRLLPRSFIWKDGHVYEIQKVTDVRRAASLKAGGAGIRYTCIVDGKESHLFYYLGKITLICPKSSTYYSVLIYRRK